jgi:formate dehydrogenase alpha subunit
MNYRVVPSICVYCGVGCGIYLEVLDNKVVGVLARPDHPVNRGILCLKGRKCHEFVHSEDRLKRPLIKKNGKFVETSWEEAISYIAQKLRGTKDRYGPDSIAVLSSAKCTNEENYLMMKFARSILGTNNVDHCARLCHASSVVGLMKTFGSGAMTNSIGDLEQSDCILITGSNTTEQHPIIASWIFRAKKRGAKVIVVDPRKIQIAEIADLYLSPRPGTDVLWLNGMMHVILKEGLYDRKFIEERTEGFEEFKKVIEEYDPDTVSRKTGIRKEDLIEAARMYGSAERSSIVYAMGITQHITGTDNVISLANLAMLTGNIGKEGTGVNPLRGHQNVQGACDMGALPNVFSGYQRVDNPELREKFERAWGVKLPDRPGLTVVEIFEAILQDEVKALYVMGENPAVTDPYTGKTCEALEKVDFLVVQDIFLSETAEFADIVLPAACFAEKEGTYTNTERRVQLGEKAVDPPGEAKPDWVIISMLALKMGGAFNYQSQKEIFDEMRRLTTIYSGITYEKIELMDGIQWPSKSEEDQGTPILHRDRFTKGKGTFVGVHYKDPHESPTDEFPLILTTGRIYFHFHSGTMTRRSPSLKDEINEAYVELNEKDAEKLGIRGGELIKVKSKRGEIELRARITPGIKEGVVFIPFHFAEAAANLLTHTHLDPLAKIPEYKVCAVKIEPLRRPPSP